MDKEQAKRNIKDTFETSFNEGKFIYFIMNLLNLKQNDIENTSFGVRQGYNIPEMFRPYISRFKRVAKYLKDNNRIDILIVHLKKGSSIEHARSRQRNFIAGYLKGNYGSDKTKDAALVAFVSPDEEDWRFSLVKMDYRFKEGKVREGFTSAKRWSFLVGKNESSHTAQSRLVRILADDQHNPTLTQLEEAFNIEKVTKEFFLKYRNLFLRIKEGLDKVVEDDPKVKKDFEEKGVDTVNFAKKFLGQIVFLYFLQKKGWFGVERDSEWGTGPKNFLRQLFNKKYGNYKNFFNDILEPLFYEALARERDDDFYSRFNCKIPFLNGGLFEPIGDYDWVHTDINLSNELFSNRNDNYEGNGVLDIFDLFNFTVKEDEPLEKEVAIDPELLGKTYEKFNAIRPDNYEEYKETLKSGRKGEENKFNKKFGVYYTPREIVHYMCQESLINYLHTAVNQELVKQPVKAAKQIKLIGPADPEQLGFRADKEIVDEKAIEKLIKYGEQFRENEAIALIKEQNIKEGKQKSSKIKPRLSESIKKNAKLIDDKLADIRVCDPAVGSGAFPVGMMAEIVKTRNVLTAYIKEQNRTSYNFKRECIEKSLYGVDIDPGAVEIAKLRLWLSLIVDEEDITKIKPLPNLDYKIMQGNSLISEFMGIDLDNDKQNNNENAKLFSIDRTKELYEILKIKKVELLNQTNTNKKKILKKEIENLIIKIFEIKLQEQKTDYFRKIREIEEKYEQHPVKEEREREIKREKDMLSRRTGFNLEEVEKQLRQYTGNQKIRPFFSWKLYFSEVFQEKGGFDVVIANPPYGANIDKMTKIYAKLYPNTTKAFKDIYKIFIELGISKLIAQKGILCYILPNTLLLQPRYKDARKFLLDFKIVEILNLGEDVFEQVVVPTCIIFIQNDNYESNIVKFGDLSYKSKFLGDLSDLSYDKIEQKKYKKTLENVFVTKIRQLNENEEYLENILDFKDAGINYQRVNIGLSEKGKSDLGKRLLYEGNKKNKEDFEYWKGKDISSYFIKPLTNRFVRISSLNNLKNNERVIINKRYFELVPKIIWRQTAYHLIATLDTKGIWFGRSIQAGIIKKDRKKDYDYKYLLSLLNSKYFRYIYALSVKEEGRVFPQIKLSKLKCLPIKKISLSKQKDFINIVDKILSLTQSTEYFQDESRQKRVKEYTQQIDKMIYTLYSLTEEEIKIVEGLDKD